MEKLKEKLTNLYIKFVTWFNKTFPQRFDFRYNKITGKLVTVPLEELEEWDAEYKKQLELFRAKLQ